MLVRPRFESWFTIFFLFLNFNIIFQIITLGPFKFNFQLHTFFLGEKPQNFTSP
ncbi:hypothetical protein Hanom_Chr11g01006291 [Helianthus anomalus]